MRPVPLAHVAFIGCFLLAARSGNAAIFNVADGDVAALVTAVTTASSNGESDTIELAAGGQYALTMAAEGTNGLPPITGTLTIEGNGATIFRTQMAPSFRIMEVQTPAQVTLNDLTISNGDSGGRASLTSRGGNIAIVLPPQSGIVARILPVNTVTLNRCIVSSGISGLGGGILVEPDDVHLTIFESFIVNNLASQGAGVALLGSGLVTIDHSTFSSNSAVGLSGGGSGGAFGGGVFTLGPGLVTITDSVISGNETSPGVMSDESRGGGIADTGGATVSIVRSEMIGNVARFGMINQGGAIHAASGNGKFNVVNVTFSNNLAGGISNQVTARSPRGAVVLSDSHGGAINNEGGAAFNLRNVTIARNFAFRGAGVAVTPGNGGTLTLANTLIAENTADDRPDCSGPITSLGYNLLGDTTGCTVTPTIGDQTGVDPLLGPASDNGGATTTHPLLAGSPALDAGDPTGCKDISNVTLTTDQRGFPRPTGPACDVGAFERGLVVELCDNCLDDDGNQLIDRDDPGCTPPLDASGSTLGDAQRGKALGKCVGALAKAGAKLVGAETKRLQKCLQTAFQCVQQKPNDVKCVAKAKKACDLATVKRQADVAKYGAVVRAKCAPPALPVADLLDDGGLGFGHESPLCERFGISALESVDDVVACTGSLHACRAQAMVAMQFPRAVELFDFAGSSSGAFACLAAGADGGGAGAGDPKVEGKRAVRCEKALAKAGAKFASGKLKLVQKCVLGVSKCMQEKNADPKCLPKARKTCTKQTAKLTGPKGLEQKLAATVAKACNDPGLGVALTRAAGGIGFDARADECAGLGVTGLAAVADVATCLNRQHECRVEQALEAELPRYRELLTLGGVSLP